MPFSEPTINEYLRITVMDKDFGKKDDILGTLMLKKCDILSKKYKNITWFDIYGSQSDNTNLFGDLMNSDSKIGSFWKGRIQLAIECFEMEKPLYHCEKIEENTLSLMNKNNISTEFFILAEAFYAFSLPKENANYSIQIRWANQELNFPEKVIFLNSITTLLLQSSIFSNRKASNHFVNGIFVNKHLPCPYLIPSLKTSPK